MMIKMKMIVLKNKVINIMKINVIIRIMTKILKIKIMKIIVMYINVLIMAEDDSKNVEDDSKSDSKSDSIENSVCWCFDEASEYNPRSC